jgi:putative transposase
MAPAGDGEHYITRGVTFILDPSPTQERLLRSYCGSARVAHNWAIAQVKESLTTRSAKREAGVAEADLTPSLSWSQFSLSTAFNASKSESAPWWREVSMHSFRSGITQAAESLA